MRRADKGGQGRENYEKKLVASANIGKDDGGQEERAAKWERGEFLLHGSSHKPTCDHQRLKRVGQRTGGWVQCDSDILEDRVFNQPFERGVHGTTISAAVQGMKW